MNLFSRFVKKYWKKSANNQQFAVDFLDFWMPEVWFSVILEARGLFLESWGPSLKISEIVVIFSAATASKNPPILRHILTFFNFLQCYFFMFFRVFAFSIFCDFRCPEAPFWYQFWSYFESPGALKKPLKLCNCRQFQRFGPFQIQCFCKCWLRMRFDSEFFRFLWFLAVLRVPFWDLLVLIVVKKEVWKKDVKNDEKGSRE